MNSRTVLPIRRAVSAAALSIMLTACSSGNPIGTAAAAPAVAAPAANGSAAGGPSSTQDETRYRTALAPHLLGSSKGIDDAFQRLLTQPAQPAAAMAADIRTIALDPAIQLLADARSYVPSGEPLTSIHAIFLDSVNQKIRRYQALVDGVSSGDRSQLAVAQAAAQQEDTDLKNWASQVTALP